MTSPQPSEHPGVTPPPTNGDIGLSTLDWRRYTTERYSGNVTCEPAFITPAYAEVLLARNIRNRNIRQDKVNKIAEDMVAGNFPLNGETIKITASKITADAQHRLHACIKAKEMAPDAFEGFWAILVRGLADKDMNTIDSGLKRSFADILKRDYGQSDCHILSATINTALVMMSPHPTSFGRSWPTFRQAEDYFVANPQIVESAQWGRRVAETLRTPSGVAGAAHHVFSELDPDAAEYFFEHLLSGANLQAGSPIMRLREFMFSQITANRRVPSTKLMAYWIKCWNYFREGREMKILKWSSTGKHPETFPRPK